MAYLIEQLSWLLILAFIAGVVIGWIACGKQAAS